MSENHFAPIGDGLVLAIIGAADEELLEKSGNHVYTNMKKDLEKLRHALAETRVTDIAGDSLQQGPGRILGIRTLPTGRQLVYRVVQPRFPVPNVQHLNNSETFDMDAKAQKFEDEDVDVTLAGVEDIIGK